jgi:transcriptional regulator with XRE-family HTH domain
MDAARVLRYARRHAGLTQRELAARSQIAQPVIARIESGASVPRVDTLDRLLEACDIGLEVVRRPGIGEDRTLPRQKLPLSPAERMKDVEAEAAVLDRLRRARVMEAKGGP